MDPGVKAVRSWLWEKQAEVNKNWPKAVGEELYRLQGEARLLARLIGVIDVGPAIKEVTEG